jgi:hydrogenase maturation factor
MRVIGGAGDDLVLCAAEGGSATPVMTELVGPVGEGDLLLVHAGVALVHLEDEAA